MMLKTLSIGAAAAAMLATGAIAQTTQPATPPTATPPAVTAPAPDAGAATSTTTTTTRTESMSFKAAMESNEMLASRLSGIAVRNSAGENLGDINDIVLDNTGKPSVVIIGVGGFLGLGEKSVGVPFSAVTFADASDGKRVVRLDVTKDALNSAPNYVYKDTAATTTTTDTKPTPKTQ